MQAELESNRRIKQVAEQREQERVYIDVKQAASLLHLTEGTIRDYLGRRLLTPYKVVAKSQGNRTLIDRAEVLALIVEA